MIDPISASLVKEVAASAAKETAKEIFKKVGNKAAEQAVNHVVGQIEETFDSQKDNPSAKMASRLTSIGLTATTGGLSEAALETRVEAAAHSACKFFEIPEAELTEGNSIGVYRQCDIFLDQDVFEYNLDQFKDMKCTSFEDMTKIWSHECGHRILRLDYPNPWTQELGADYFSGIRSEMLGLPSSNFEEMLGSTKASASHPAGNLRVQAIEYGRNIVRNFEANGIQPTIQNCKAAFEQSPFSKITSENSGNQAYAAFVDDKAWHASEAKKAQENANYYSNEAKKAIEKGDYSRAKDLEGKAQSYQTKVKDEISAQDRCTKLVDNDEFHHLRDNDKAIEYVMSNDETIKEASELKEKDDKTGEDKNLNNQDNASNNSDINGDIEDENRDLDEIGKVGGRYQDLKDEGWGWSTKPPTEVHHMPADTISPLERSDGPAIVMDYYDHRQTASCGNSRDAQAYRAKQKELIEQGKFREAFQMDVDDIRSKFGDKYDEAIKNAEEYLDKLEQENKI